MSRYKHLNFTKEQQKELAKLEKCMAVTKFPTGHITKRISVRMALEKIGNNKTISTLLHSVPMLLQGESEILTDFGIEHRLFSRSLSKTHLGNYSLCSDLFINKNTSIIKFYKEIGFSLSTKQEKLKKLITYMKGKDGIKTI